MKRLPYQAIVDVNCVIEKRECSPFVLSANRAGFSPDSSHLIVGYKENSDSDTPLDFDIWDLRNWTQSNKPVKNYSSRTSQYAPSIGRNGDLLVLAPNSITLPTQPDYSPHGTDTMALD